MKNKQAFTLIELLVVVLIIGVLAAVALPQYQRAVEKAKYTHLITLVEAIYKAQQVFKAANGYATADFNELDIDFPQTETLATNPMGGVVGVRVGGKYRCVLNTNYSLLTSNYTVCYFGDLKYGRWGNGQRVCISDNTKSERFCKYITGIEKSQGSANGVWWLWPFQN